MTKEEFKKLSDLASQWYAENMMNYLKEYDWDKFIMVADYSTMFGSKRNRYDLYKNGIKITPYINKKGEYKSNETESAKKIDEKYAQMGMSTVDLRTLTDDDTKYNIWEFTLYSNGKYESSFIWDNEASIQNLLESIHIREQIFVENIFCINIEEEYTSICVIVEINAQKEVKLQRRIITINNEIKEIGIHVEDRWLDSILRFQAQTNDSGLGINVIKWNKATFNVPQNEYDFDPDKDVSFEWREDLA